MERDISDLEANIKSSDIALETDYDNTVSDPTFFDRYQNFKSDLQLKMTKWEKIQEELDGLAAQDNV